MYGFNFCLFFSLRKVDNNNDAWIYDPYTIVDPFLWMPSLSMNKYKIKLLLFFVFFWSCAHCSSIFLSTDGTFNDACVCSFQWWSW